jgi:hypothetical protein
VGREARAAAPGGAAVAAARARTERQRLGRQAAPARRLEAYRRKYPDWRDALPAAAEALFNLNRYAKRRSCQADHRAWIYGLKTGFLRLLCRLGLATEAKVHAVPREGKPCFAYHGGEDCERCDGTGWYVLPGPQEFIAFRFEVGGTPFAWHQPRELVDWPVELRDDAEPWEPEGGAKPVALPAREFAAAKDLLQFVLDAAADAG